MSELGLKMMGKDPNGNAKAIKTDIKGNIGVKLDANVIQALDDVSATLTFVNKIQGDTSINPNLFGYRITTTFGSPSTFFTEATTSAYNLISALDGSVSSLGTGGTTNGQYHQHIFSIDILTDLKIKGIIPESWTVEDLINHINEIIIKWYGYGIGANDSVSTDGARLQVWQPGSGTWSSGETAQGATPSIIELTLSPYDIDTNGFIHVMARSEYPSDGVNNSVIYTDFVKLDVNLIGVEAIRTISSMIGRHVEDNSNAEMTFVKDDQGKSVLRVVDAAPFAYDDVNNRLFVDVEKSVLEPKLDLSNEKLSILTESPNTIIETVFAQAVYSSDQNKVLEAPTNAKGAIIWLYTSSASGTFAAGEGVRLRTQVSMGGAYAVYPFELASDRVTGSFRQQTHIWLPGADLGDAALTTASTVKIAKIPPQSHLKVFMDINGTFDEGQGFGIRVVVLWLK